MGKVVLLPIVTDYTSNTISYLIKQDSIKTPSETVENSDLKIYLAPNPSNNGRFKIVNTGKKPLIIKNTSASCGCTTPSKPEAPILPSKHDFIKVVFEPKPSQKGTIEKTVSVEANTSQKLHIIKIKAFVE